MVDHLYYWTVTYWLELETWLWLLYGGGLGLVLAMAFTYWLDGRKEPPEEIILPRKTPMTDEMRQMLTTRQRKHYDYIND